MNFSFPALLAIDERLNGNKIQQLIEPACTKVVKVERYTQNRAKGYVLRSAHEEVLVLLNSAQAPEAFSKVLRMDAPEFSKEALSADTRKTWIKHPMLISGDQPLDYEELLEQVLDSWRNAFSYLEEHDDYTGLRPPQIGAVHAVHAHWALPNQVATVVMPTGTGKTETMLSVLVSKRLKKLLVVVPTDALRTQISRKFLSLGILKELEDQVVGLKVVSKKALYPVVGILKHKPRNIHEVDRLFEKCNVVVTTMSIVGQCEKLIQERIAVHCPYLFVDEAHHIGAPTWRGFRDVFESNHVVQFTATPFRNDDEHIGGKIIFNYPLKKAQEEGFFKPIHFKPVTEFNASKADQAIAEKAVAQLKQDRTQYNHLLMARVKDVNRAKEVFEIYKQWPEFNPVQIHTGIKSKTEREAIRKKIVNGEAQIIICVDMLGEGFDLPELKVAAFHDIRKSLAITLQLAGRFTRSRTDLGDATFVANIADVDVGPELQKLYSHDPDWNALLREMSTGVIQEQEDLWNFIEGFQNFPDDIPLLNVRPAMSTVAYKTKCTDWTPTQFEDGLEGVDSLERIHHDINSRRRTLIAVTARKTPIKWAKIEGIHDWDWELYIIFWDKEQNLLFIHTSSNNGFYKELAQAVAGSDAELVNGPEIFRCFGGINRLRLQNVGLIEQLAKLIRYTMRSGSDVGHGLSEAQRRNVNKANIFGNGYERGHQSAIGCSYKGRIWSHRKTNVEALTKWCSFVGEKLLDESIDPDEVLEGTLVPKPVAERPSLMPITIDWPHEIYGQSETAVKFTMEDAGSAFLTETEIKLKNPSETGNILFEISTESVKVEVEMVLFEQDEVLDYRFSILGTKKAWIKAGSAPRDLTKYFYDNPPVVWFADGSSLEGNQFIELKRNHPPYPTENIQAWDWEGIDLTTESQGTAKSPDSIQHYVIERLKTQNYDVIFDDDGKGESADVVCIRKREKKLEVEFYHCKYSKKAKAGARIDDLYEVCGQAQKSIHWREDMPGLFSHMLRREPKRKDGTESTRYEVGNETILITLREMSRFLPVELKICVVQPGVSKGSISYDQLQLLSVTENYLMETYMLPFEVIASH